MSIVEAVGKEYDALIERVAMRSAVANNGGEWATHFTEEQKEHWRKFAAERHVRAGFRRPWRDGGEGSGQMTLSTLRTSQGELFAFILDFNPDVTAQVSPSCEAVAGRPDHPPTIDPAGDVPHQESIA